MPLNLTEYNVATWSGFEDPEEQPLWPDEQPLCEAKKGDSRRITYRGREVICTITLIDHSDCIGPCYVMFKIQDVRR